MIGADTVYLTVLPYRTTSRSLRLDFRAFFRLVAVVLCDSTTG